MVFFGFLARLFLTAFFTCVRFGLGLTCDGFGGVAGLGAIVLAGATVGAAFEFLTAFD